MVSVLGNEIDFEIDLFQVELGLDAMDAYVKRRQSHTKQRTQATVLARVHHTLTELAKLEFGGQRSQPQGYDPNNLMI